MAKQPETADTRYSIPEILDMMKANKLTHFKVGGIELTMDPSSWSPPPPIQTPEELQKIIASGGQGLTDEEALFYSVEGGIWQEPDTAKN